MNKLLKLIKGSTRLITCFIPNTMLAKIASELVLWGFESLVKNTKTKHDDEALRIVKDVLSKGKIK